MSWLLAIETSAVRGSVALLRDGVVVGERVLDVPRQHNELLLGEISALLRAAGIESRALAALAFGYGPGSFTGVRLAAAAAQALAWAHELPVFAVDCGEALAELAWRSHEHRQRADAYSANRQRSAAQHAEQFEGDAVAAQPDVLVALDARMGQLYWLQVCGARVHTTNAWRVVGWAELASEWQVPERFIAIGDAWSDQRFPAALRAASSMVCEHAVAQAVDIGALAWQRWLAGQRPAPQQAQPLYLRGADAWA